MPDQSIYIERVIAAVEDLRAFGRGDAATLTDQILADLSDALREGVILDVLHAEICELITKRLKDHVDRAAVILALREVL